MENKIIAVIDATQIINWQLKTNYTTRDMFAFATAKKLKLLCHAPGLPLRIPNYQETYHYEYTETQTITTTHKESGRELLVCKKCLPTMFPCFSPSNDRVEQYPGKYFNPMNTESGKNYVSDLAEYRESAGILEIYADPHKALSASDYEQYSDEELDALDELHGKYDVLLYQKVYPPEIVRFDLQAAYFHMYKDCAPEEDGYQLTGFKPGSTDFFMEQWWLEYFINEKKQTLKSITIGKQAKSQKAKAWKPQDFGLPEIFATLEPDANFWRNKKVTLKKRAEYINWQTQILSPSNAGKTHRAVCDEIAKSERDVTRGAVIAATYSVMALRKLGRKDAKT